MAELPITVASFNHYLNEGKLMGTRCPACNEVYLPPRAICPECQSAGMEWQEMPGEGRLAAFTSVYVGPSFMNALGHSRENPYVSGIVELSNGAKISALILGVDATRPESIVVGSPVRVEFVDRGEGDKRQAVLAFRA